MGMISFSAPKHLRAERFKNPGMRPTARVREEEDKRGASG